MNPQYEERVSNMRTNINYGFYSKIALRCFAKAKSVMDQGKEKIDCFGAGYLLLQENIVTCEVFAALAVESFLNDYAASHLGDKVFYENFEGLPALSKLQLISLLFFEKSFAKSSELYALMKTCFKNRNEIAHNKSVDGSHYAISEEEWIELQQIRKELEIDETEPNDEQWKELKSDFQQAYLAIKTIVSLAVFIDSHDPNAQARFVLFGCSDFFCPCDTCTQEMCQIVTQLFSQMKSKPLDEDGQTNL